MGKQSKSYQEQLIRLMLLPIILVMAVGGFSLFYQYQQQRESQLLGFTKAVVQILSADMMQIALVGNPDLVSKADSQLGAFTAIEGVRLYRKGCNVLYRYEQARDTANRRVDDDYRFACEAELLDDELEWHIEKSEWGVYHVIYPVKYRGRTFGRLGVRLSDQDFARDMGQYGATVLLSMLALLFVIWRFSGRSLGRVTEPLTQLTTILDGMRLSKNFSITPSVPDRLPTNCGIKEIVGLYQGVGLLLDEVNQYQESLELKVSERTHDLAVANLNLQAQKDALDLTALVTISDKTGLLLEANDNFCNATGFAREQLIGNSPSLYSSGIHSKPFWKEMWKTIEGGDSWRGEVCNRNQSGELYWVNLAIVPLFDDAEAPQRYLSIGVDITQSKQLQSASEKNAYQQGLLEMSAGILHNLGNAVTGMQGHTLRLKKKLSLLSEIVRILRRSTADDGIIHEQVDAEQKLEKALQVLNMSTNSIEGKVIPGLDTLLGDLVSSLEHASGIISIQQSASSPNQQKTRYLLHELLEDVITMHSESIASHQIVIKRSFDNRIGEIEAPRNPFMHMLLNLLKNGEEAIAAEQARLLELGQSDHYEGTLDISTELTPNEEIIIRIGDNGIGIEPELLSKVFNYGLTNKKAGSGYGLHNAANFIRAQSGQISVESDGIGKGTTFIMSLPLTAVPS